MRPAKASASLGSKLEPVASGDSGGLLAWESVTVTGYWMSDQHRAAPGFRKRAHAVRVKHPSRLQQARVSGQFTTCRSTTGREFPSQTGCAHGGGRRLSHDRALAPSAQESSLQYRLVLPSAKTLARATPNSLGWVGLGLRRNPYGPKGMSGPTSCRSPAIDASHSFRVGGPCPRRSSAATSVRRRSQFNPANRWSRPHHTTGRDRAQNAAHSGMWGTTARNDTRLAVGACS